MTTKILQFLGDNRIGQVDGDLQHLAFHVDRSARRRKLARKRWAKDRVPQGDIIRLVLDSHERGDRDEAIWRAFLAAHFGRESADHAVEGQVGSAVRLLCAFGTSPRWTWNVVRDERHAFRRWLVSHAAELRTLSFGNHRKFESKKPQRIWEVVSSFIALATDHGGGAASIIDLPADKEADAFDVLYERLRHLHRFGRTGRFDFLALLADLGLIDACPRRCYLRGATGPLRGARLLFGDRSVVELDDLAAALSQALGVSPHVVEDALCNWQKGRPT